jgi:hypothetical protein
VHATLLPFSQVASTYRPTTLLGFQVTPTLQKAVLTACIMALVSLLPVGPASIVGSTVAGLAA